MTCLPVTIVVNQGVAGGCIELKLQTTGAHWSLGSRGESDLGFSYNALEFDGVPEPLVSTMEFIGSVLRIWVVAASDNASYCSITAYLEIPAGAEYVCVSCSSNCDANVAIKLVEDVLIGLDDRPSIFKIPKSTPDVVPCRIIAYGIRASGVLGVTLGPVSEGDSVAWARGHEWVGRSWFSFNSSLGMISVSEVSFDSNNVKIAFDCEQSVSDNCVVTLDLYIQMMSSEAASRWTSGQTRGVCLNLTDVIAATVVAQLGTQRPRPLTQASTFFGFDDMRLIA